MKTAFSLAGLAVVLSGVSLAQGADDCSNAQVIAGLGPHFFDNTAATKDGPNDCSTFPVRKDVWFRWTAPANGGYVWSDCNATSFDTRVAVYDMQACPVTQAPLVCSDVGCSGMGTRLSFPTVAGNDYLIRVGSRNIGQSGTGNFILIDDPCWFQSDDAYEDNDDCPQAWPLGDGNYLALWTSKADKDWFQFDVADGATLSVDLIFTHATGNLECYLLDACQGTFLDNGGSSTDNENVTWTNTTGACVSTVFQVDHWNSDPASECQTYDMLVTGSSAPGTCGGGLGTKYCSPSNPNSSGQSAEIWAVGSDKVADNDVTLDAIQLAVSQFGMFVNSMSPGSVTPPGSQGVLCLSGGIGRHNSSILNSGANGEFSLVLDLTDIPTPGGQVAIQPGETWYWQAWFRDSNPGTTSNFTDGISITFQ